MIIDDKIFDKILEEPSEEPEITIKQWLFFVFSRVLLDGAGFSGKRPLGSSGWDQEFIMAYAKYELIEVVVNEDGELDDYNSKEVDMIHLQLIKYLLHIKVLPPQEFLQEFLKNIGINGF
jgi:hypothetical protein